MPERNPANVQLDFPQLVADMIDQLKLIGSVGLLDFDPIVRPVYIVGDRDLAVQVQEIVWLPAENFAIVSANPASAAVLIDTTALPAGDYDVISGWTMANMGAPGDLQLQHRNAANSATLAFWPGVQNVNGATGPDNARRFALRLDDDERLRYHMVIGGGGVNSRVACWMQVKRRVTP